MKNAKSIAIIASLCFITVGWAAWYGTTYHDGDPEGYVAITTQPADGITQSTGAGGYNLSEAYGMTQGRYYYFVKGVKEINGQGNQGKYWSLCNYDRAVPKTGCDIHLIPFDDK